MRFRIKKIDWLIIRGFIGPYLASFFVAEFVLIMQFLWKYIDDFLGKGFTVLDLMELILYYGVTIIPMAIPLTVLISSVMVFGDMGEKYELSSMKSAGISLLRIMKAGIYISVLTAFFSLFSSNYLKPKANYQFFERFTKMKRQKPSLSIEAEVFNKQFSNYVIRVDEKDKDGKTIHDVLIYDQTNPDRNLINITTARKGEMFTTEKGGNFVMNLQDGVQYRELTRKFRKDESVPSKRVERSYPFIRTRFGEFTKVFDMSEFDPAKRTISLNRNQHDLMNTFQLLEAIDSLELEINELINTNRYDFSGLIIDPKKKLVHHPRSKEYRAAQLESETAKKVNQAKEKQGLPKLDHTKKSSVKYLEKQLKKLEEEPILLQPPDLDFRNLEHHYESYTSTALTDLVIIAGRNAQTQRDKTFSNKTKKADFRYMQSKYRIRLNQQYSWAFVCIIFLFIGAPLGSIVRKGGYGYPLLFAIIFFMIFIVGQIMGDRLHRSREMSEYIAAWLPCLMLLPIAIFLTYKAMTDSKILDFDRFFKWLNSLGLGKNAES